ncbi:molybdopterin molybdotransferase MoeA [Aestuariispira ectoiniformans]|uniref:molybdopterin molybdotransferase MoeA n=1 Tax=Aestuariispira ectoiniformans TaxID=2775080 RepID=UPI00223AB01D|nr:gephyrin-like molybdotransferase Glp [Aestuariispira ectoiniformans]
MISVDDARTRILAALGPLPAEQISIRNALGRVLAEDVKARRTQPPTAVSAMDGYAVRACDIPSPGTELEIIGEAPAGGVCDRPVGEGQAVRIFTGGPMPEGADAVVMQEDTEKPNESTVRINLPPHSGKFVRAAGLDFAEGQTLLEAGQTLSARDVGLLAAMNVPWIMVHRRPRVAILATGDEIVMPGEPMGPSQIVSSNSLGLAATLEALDCDPILLGVARDNAEHLKSMASAAASADLLITTGGASVGDHDLIQSVLGETGLQVDFWKIAMRPGKPLIFGHLNQTPMIGLPGNPVSTLVCSTVFVAPAVAKLSGKASEAFTHRSKAVLDCDIPQNDHREEYMRAVFTNAPGESLRVKPFEKQDSSMLSRLSGAGCLVVRPAHSAPMKAGQLVDIIQFPSSHRIL